jgi:hypothetical protein
MGPLFNPRRLARTPGFIQEGLYDDLDMAEQDDYSALPPPPQQRGGLSEMLQAAPDAPLPPPSREYDGGPSVDPGPQARQRITLEAAPLPPKPGLMRKIIGMAAGAYMPQVGREIMAPGYDRQMREYNANKQRQMDEGKLNVQLADEEQKWAHAGAEGSRSAAEQARRRKMDAETGNLGRRPVTVNRNERLADPMTGKVLLEAEESAEKLPTTLEGAATRALSIQDPAEREDMLKRITDAHNLLHPEKPITQIKVGGNGEIVAVTVDPKKVAAAGGSMKVGQVTPRPVRGPSSNNATPQGGGLIPTAAAVVDNPNLFRSYTPTEKAKVISSLRANGHVDAANRLGGKQLSEKSVDHISSADHAMAILDDLAGSFKAAEKYVGPIAGLQAVNPYSDAQKLQAEVDRVRQNVGKLLEGGVLRKEDEIKYTKILATLNDTPSTAASKIGGIRGDIDQKVKAYKANLKKSGYDMSGFDGGAETPPPASDSGSVRMIHPKTGKIHLVPAKDVAAAEAASYKRAK